MRSALYFLTAFALAGGVHAQTAGSKMTPELYEQALEDMQYWDAQRGRYTKTQARAQALYPARRNSPLRDLNISDDEVREIQLIAHRYLPPDYVNISPVVSDCPCEEGPACTAQVYVVAQGKEKARGLQLSRMNDRWGVGIVQQWWFRREAIVRQKTGNSFLDWYLEQKAVNELYEEFPICPSQLQPESKTASTLESAETK